DRHLFRAYDSTIAAEAAPTPQRKSPWGQKPARGNPAAMHNRDDTGENHMQTVEGRIVLVTGAAMGMGRLYAERAIAERAAGVVLWDIDGRQLAETQAELGGTAANVHAYVVDVASLADITTAATRVRAEVGHPD